MLGIGQTAVLTIQLPRAHTRQACTGDRHAAIAVVGGVEIDQAFVHQAVAVGREARMPQHEQQLVLERREVTRRLRVQTLAQCDCAVQHVLRRHAPAVTTNLHFLPVPPAVFAYPPQVIVGQRLPCRFLRQCELIVEQRRLQLNEAGEARHQGARSAVLERRTERHQHVAERVIARQHLHRRPRTRVRRAKHQQPGVRMRHQTFPYRGPFELHRACEHATHRVRQQAHRLAAHLARVERCFDGDRQPPRLFFDRLAPVERKLDHLVRLRQVFGNVFVA